ncbi:MAG: hypothetical protein ACOC6H_04095 [Thermoproteota archaeon]
MDYLKREFYASMSEDGRITLPKRIARRYPTEERNWQETLQKSLYIL